MSDLFYKNLKAFHQISDMTDINFYSAVPEDWCVIMTDIKGSTQAIDSGNYKDVNVAGVTTIIATENACRGIDIPAIFGGDGATLFIPESYTDKVSEALSFSRKKARDEFNLDLRIAIIPMREILKYNKNIFLAKMKLANETYMATAIGEGLILAEDLTKKSDLFLVSDLIPAVGSHEGLECRWNPIQSQSGEMLSLLIKSQKNEDSDLFKNMILKIQSLVPDMQPVRAHKLSLSWPPMHLIKEIKAKTSGMYQKISYYLTLFKLYVLTLIVRGQIQKPESLVSKYLNELSSNTDYIKFDESLKMVIDINLDQKKKLITYLDSLEQSGQIFYGVHSSKQALMTCFMRSTKNHIHYIDGGDGGYAMASKVLKNKLAAVKLQY
jgi:hypothetical protein